MCKGGWALAVVLWASTGATAVLVDNFNGYQLGDVGTVSTTWKATVDVTIVTDPTDAANQVIRMQENTGVQKAAYCMLSSEATIPDGATKTLYLRFRATNPIDSAFGFANMDAPDVGGSDWGNFGPQVSVNSGNFRVRNSGSWSITGTYTPLDWYNLWIVVDNAADTMKVYLHNRPGQAATEADRVLAGSVDTFGFRNKVTGPLTRFYWRAQNPGGERYVWIDDIFVVEGTSLAVPGDITGPATNPQPADKATDVLRDMTLSWTPGPYAATHNVYFGTSLDDVNTAVAGSPLEVSVNQAASTFNPGRLALGQTYYWRVDEVNAPPTDSTVFRGELWTFTVEPLVYEVNGITATASSSDATVSPANTVNKSGLTGDLHGTEPKTMWVSAKGAATPVWLQYDLGKVYKLQDMWVWNYNVDFEEALGLSIQNATIEYSADAVNWTTLGSFDFAQGISADNYEHNTTVAFGGVAVRYVKITANSTYGGKQYGLSEVRFYYFPVTAREPSPAVGTTDVAADVTLSWRSGREAASHSVYLGTDANALTLAGSSAINSFSPAHLSLGTKCYWRVDEVNTAEAISTWAGDVWNFTTSAFIAVDDMESYNDSTNKMFDTWIDGYGTPATNASVVGLNSAANGTFGSTTIFHGGKQSMPLAYNNTSAVPNAEATRTFEAAEDWTRNGVKVLTLYFYGQATNATNVPLWIKVTDQNGKSAKVTFGAAAGEDAAALAEPAWTTWNIPLSSLSGVTLTKVKSMTIGLGTGAGTGTLYIDDIRLFAAVTTTTVTPTLVGQWKLDNDVKDSSGTGNNGTATGGPTFVAAGRVGASLKLDGTDDYVDCGTAASLDITDQVTLSAWVKPTNFANSAYQTFVAKGDHAYVLQHTNTNLLQFCIYDGTWYSANSTAVTSTMNNTWHHVAGTYDGTQLKLFVDGAIAASSLHTGDIDTATHAVNIGRNAEYSSRFFTGEIDEVRVYHGALSTTEVKKLANP